MTTSTTVSFGTRVGSAIGKSAAYVGHASISAAQHTGRFGQDVASGAQTGYALKAQELSARRAQIAAARTTPIAIAVTVSKTAKRATAKA